MKNIKYIIFVVTLAFWVDASSQFTIQYKKNSNETVWMPVDFDTDLNMFKIEHCLHLNGTLNIPILQFQWNGEDIDNVTIKRYVNNNDHAVYSTCFNFQFSEIESDTNIITLNAGDDGIGFEDWPNCLPCTNKPLTYNNLSFQIDGAKMNGGALDTHYIQIHLTTNKGFSSASDFYHTTDYDDCQPAPPVEDITVASSKINSLKYLSNYGAQLNYPITGFNINNPVFCYTIDDTNNITSLSNRTDYRCYPNDPNTTTCGAIPSVSFTTNFDTRGGGTLFTSYLNNVSQHNLDNAIQTALSNSGLYQDFTYCDLATNWGDQDVIFNLVFNSTVRNIKYITSVSSNPIELVNINSDTVQISMKAQIWNGIELIEVDGVPIRDCDSSFEVHKTLIQRSVTYSIPSHHKYTINLNGNSETLTQSLIQQKFASEIANEIQDDPSLSIVIMKDANGNEIASTDTAIFQDWYNDTVNFFESDTNCPNKRTFFFDLESNNPCNEEINEINDIEFEVTLFTLKMINPNENYYFCNENEEFYTLEDIQSNLIRKLGGTTFDIIFYDDNGDIIESENTQIPFADSSDGYYQQTFKVRSRGILPAGMCGIYPTNGSGNPYVFTSEESEITVIFDCCPNPTDFMSTGTTDTSVSLAWNPLGFEEQWQILYGLNGTVDTANNIGSTVVVYDNPQVEITGLVPSNEYEFYVRAICDSDEDGWVGPIIESTTCSNCTSFKPSTTKKYVLSAWVKEDHQEITLPNYNDLDLENVKNMLNQLVARYKDEYAVLNGTNIQALENLKDDGNLYGNLNSEAEITDFNYSISRGFRFRFGSDEPFHFFKVDVGGTSIINFGNIISVSINPDAIIQNSFELAVDYDANGEADANSIYSFGDNTYKLSTPIIIPSKQVFNYESSYINLKFLNGLDEIIESKNFYASGNIIDDWQRIQDDFIIPNGTVRLKVELVNDFQGDVFFDDIRIFPFNGNMKSFVYDQISQKLMAELDENNYATFYEYDNEGGLIRVKKETEKGVFTIQETRSGNIKK